MKDVKPQGVIYNKLPPLPKYANIWDMNKGDMGPNSELTLKQLYRKISSFIHASRRKEETGIVGNRFCQCDRPIW